MKPQWNSEHWLAVDMKRDWGEGENEPDELRSDVLEQPELHIALYTQTANTIILVGTTVVPLHSASHPRVALTLRAPRSKARRRKGLSDTSGTISIEWSKQLERSWGAMMKDESLATHMRFDFYASVLSMLSSLGSASEKLCWFMYVLDRDAGGTISSDDLFVFIKALIGCGLDNSAVQTTVDTAMEHMAKRRGCTVEELDEKGLSKDDICMLVPDEDLLHRLQINLGKGSFNHKTLSSSGSGSGGGGSRGAIGDQG